MQYRYLAVIILLFLACLSGCDLGEYHSIGSSPDRITAENEVLDYLLDEYDNLPDDEFTKVIYSYSKDNHAIKNAIWYHKGAGQLGVEYDIYSGYCCMWKGVTQSKLSQLVKAEKGVLYADFLAKPDPVGYRGDF